MAKKTSGWLLGLTATASPDDTVFGTHKVAGAGTDLHLRAGHAGADRAGDGTRARHRSPSSLPRAVRYLAHLLTRTGRSVAADLYGDDQPERLAQPVRGRLRLGWPASRLRQPPAVTHRLPGFLRRPGQAWHWVDPMTGAASPHWQRDAGLRSAETQTGMKPLVRTTCGSR
jgi:hypothetical protein